MTIDPKVTVVFNCILAIILWLATGTVTFPDFVTASTAHHITSTAAFLGALMTTINVVLSGYSSAKKGPFVSTDVTPQMPRGLPVILLAVIAGGLLLAMSGQGAQAQTPLPPHRAKALPVKALPNLDSILKSLQTISLEDLQAADADAKATGDVNASSCYEGIITLVQAQQTAQAAQANLPKVHIFTTFQQGRDLVVALRSGSGVRTKCAPLAEEIKQDVTTLIAAIAGGTISAATFFGAGL